MLSRDEYLVQLRSQLDAANRQLERYSYRSLEAEQERSIRHLLERGHELGRACLLVGEGGLPRALWILYRVLLENLFLMSWVALAEENAELYARSAKGALARAARRSLERRTAKVHDPDSGHDKTGEAIPRMLEMEARLPNMEQIADRCGLGVVYDSMYRTASLEVHGNTFELPITQDHEGSVAVLPAVTALVQACLLIADNRLQSGRETARDELLRVLGLPTGR